MVRNIFYYGTTKKIIVGFASCFDDIRYVDGHGQTILVPIHYSPKEKFIELIQANPDFDNTNFDITLPQMGFEITDIKFDSSRHTNPLSKIDDVDSTSGEQYMFNRVPYNFEVSLYIAARRFEDSLKIVEQIIPFFTPELTITINDKEDYNLQTNVPIILNDAQFDIDYEGSFNTKRTITWTLNFTVKGFYYSNPRDAKRIKQSIVELHNEDFDRYFTKYTATVDPFEATPSEPHTIVETTETVLNDD